MEASPRDTAQGTEHVTPERGEPEPVEGRPGSDGPDDFDASNDVDASDEVDASNGIDGPDGIEDTDDVEEGVTADGPEPEEMFAGGPEVEVELRPQRRLRIWQLAPIVALAATGSLMFAFPLAFDFGDSGAVIAMLGLLICSCAAGWGMMAARRVGHTWPGLPQRGSGRRPDWRVVLAYVVLVAAVVVLAVWRVARLR
ncbi:hypothetical protein BM536_009030 [Streptomyces phaeoluteigriseus]|uniref:Transmembrane protein n=1 Tax=Streptomyces phaeoluteigriseus TaxID=114686 RepID=A0A1V6MVD0_9ACTN|nr:hypothetical protein [Streptomyces phaeoluteigriseus]OQD56389.1 hypothetical protein BM536_009030 [Streptomyces phaeoluteigriseus]